MLFDPLPHQIEDSAALLEYEYSYLWADPGTGKTFTAIKAIKDGGFDRVVVVCPRAAITMWTEELRAHLKYDSRMGNKHYIAEGIRSGKPKGLLHQDAIVMSFGVARNLRKSFDPYVMTRFQTLTELRSRSPKEGRSWEDRLKVVFIIDEAHNLKSVTAKQTQQILGIGEGGFGLLKGMAAVWQLTGTPVTRYNDDLYTQLIVGRREILKHYKADTYGKFVRQFCRTELKSYGGGPKKRVVVGNTNTATLIRMLKDCKAIRRELEDVWDTMPPITYRVIDADYKNVPPAGIAGMSEAELNKALSPQYDADGNKIESPASRIRRQLGVAKVKSAVEYIREYGQAPYLIGYWHKDVGDALANALGSDHARIDGSTSSKERQQTEAAFNAGNLNGVLGQMQALNTAVNLQGACSHVLILEELLSPAMLEQFIARVFRRGQTKHVQVDFLRSTHDLDLAFLNIRTNKEKENKKLGL